MNETARSALQRTRNVTADLLDRYEKDKAEYLRNLKRTQTSIDGLRAELRDLDDVLEREPKDA